MHQRDMEVDISSSTINKRNHGFQQTLSVAQEFVGDPRKDSRL